MKNIYCGFIFFMPSKYKKLFLLKALQDLHFKNHNASFKKAYCFRNSKNEEYRILALRILGLSCYKTRKYTDSSFYFEKLSEIESSQENWSNLANAATRAGFIQKGEQAFANIFRSSSISQTVVPTSIPYLFYNYMTALRDAGEYYKAFIQLNELIKIYSALETTNQNVLFNKQVPFFNQTLKQSYVILENIKEKFDLKLWADSFSKYLDEEGKEELKAVREKIGF